MIILTGHQAPGTRGARLADGERSIRIHGQDVAVRAEVVKLNSASAHADSHQLIARLRSMEHAPDRVFVVHGEMSASDQLRQRISHELHWQAQVPGARLHRRAVGWGLACVGCGNIAPNSLNFQKESAWRLSSAAWRHISLEICPGRGVPVKTRQRCKSSRLAMAFGENWGRK